MDLLIVLFTMLRGCFLNHAALLAENVALRHQLAVLQRSVSRPQFRARDRLFWVLLSRLWSGWRSALVLVQPATVIAWHRQGFRLFWSWKSRGQPGRPALDSAVRALIRRLSRENPRWGSPRIRAEIHLLGHAVAQSTVEKYIVRDRQPTSPSWRTFLDNHVGTLASVDFLTVPTLTFRVLYDFVVLRHERRQVVHFGITTHPSAVWVRQQIREAFPFDSAPRYLIRDNDGIYGSGFKAFLTNCGIEEVRIAPRSPWQNPFVERMIGTLRRELLDHVIVLNEAHLRRLLSQYLTYYHTARPHTRLDRNSPQPREVEPPERGRVVAVPMVGGLHRRYTRGAA